MSETTPQPRPPADPSGTPRSAQTAEEIYSSFPPLDPKPDSYLQWRGSQQMNILLLVICVMVVLFLVAWTFTRPEAADAVAVLRTPEGATPDPAEVRELLRELQERHSEQLTGLFQMLVMSALVPLFTLLAGYVFGRTRRPPSGGGEGPEE